MANWRLSIKKICDVKPVKLSTSAKNESSILFLNLKKFYFIQKSKKFRKITRQFFMHRRKMIKNLTTNYLTKITVSPQKLGLNLT